jgi:hypothetical protein
MQPTDLTQPERDNASGYASADVFDEDEPEQTTVDEVRDPMSGYTSADAMEPDAA